MSTTITKRTHPPDQGWLHTTFTLKSADRLPQEDAERCVCCFADPATYDIALCAQNGKKLLGVVRRKNWTPSTK